MNTLFGSKGIMQYLIVGAVAIAVAYYLYVKFDEYNRLLLIQRNDIECLKTEVTKLEKTIFAYNMSSANGILDYGDESCESVQERSHSTIESNEVDLNSHDVDLDSRDLSDEVELSSKPYNANTCGDMNINVGDVCNDTLITDDGPTNILSATIKKIGTTSRSKSKGERSVVIDLNDESEDKDQEANSKEENSQEDKSQEDNSQEEVSQEDKSENDEESKKKKKNKKADLESIYNPDTGRKVSIHSKLGKKLLKKQEKKKKNK